MLKKRLLAFSIAEALVTMLIVALIIMLTMPVVSKKNVKGSGTKGSWECVRDPETGVYKSISYYPEDTANPNAEKVPYGKVAEDGKSCIFTPPKSARNFTVNVIGGGGGGASSSVARDSDAFSTVGTDTYIPEYTGYYDILLIGGGGAGGCVECGHGPAGNGALGGAAGGVLLKKGYLLTKGKS